MSLKTKICIGFFIFGIWTSAEGQFLKVMSYNIRFDNPEDKPHDWKSRAPFVLNQIKKFEPDIIGLQEALIHQIEDLETELPGYTWVGIGRDGGLDSGEFTPIFIKESRFNIVESGNRWLSETSDTASVGWDARFPRILTWVVLEDKIANSELLVVNTHFDHEGKVAREKSMQLTYNTFFETSNDRQFIFTGDLNTSPDETPYQWLMDKEKLIDSYIDAYFRSGPTGTFNAFNYDQTGKRIDYIFHSKNFQTIRYEVFQEWYNGILPSDHWPVLATLIYKK